MADDPKSGSEPDDGSESRVRSRDDPSYWDELVRQVEHGWVRERIGTGKRHTIGRFEGIREIGRGGYGLVLLVRDPNLDREVALKLCRAPRPGGEDAIFREAQLLAKLSHPNVIRVYEAGHYGDDVFYVMERVVGMNGGKFIYECESLEQIITVYIAAGTGLAAAHDHGILHGDFKPGNILIPNDGGPVRVADFGLAQLMFEDGEGPRHRLGTLPYMAPEVLRGEPGDARSDQWSFCIALWETLEGVRPFAGTTATKLLESICSGAPRVVETEELDAEAVRAVVRVGLSIDPTERYADMHTLVRELGKLLAPPGGRTVGGNSGHGRPREDEGPLLNAPAEARAKSAGSLAMILVVLMLAWMRPLPPAPEPAHEEVSTKPPPAKDDREPEPAGVTPELVIDLIETGVLDEAHDLWQVEAQRRAVATVPTHLDSTQIARAYLDRAQEFRSARKLANAIAATNFASAWGYAAEQDLRCYGEPTDEAESLIREADMLRAEIRRQQDLSDRQGK